MPGAWALLTTLSPVGPLHKIFDFLPPAPAPDHRWLPAEDWAGARARLRPNFGHPATASRRALDVAVDGV